MSNAACCSLSAYLLHQQFRSRITRPDLLQHTSTPLLLRWQVLESDTMTLAVTCLLRSMRRRHTPTHSFSLLYSTLKVASGLASTTVIDTLER